MLRSTVTLLVSAALAVVVLAAPIPRDRRPEPVRFPFKVGAKWVYAVGGGEYSDVVTSVNEADGKRIVTLETTWTDGAKWSSKLEVSDAGLFRVDLDGPLTPPLCLLKFPHPPGTTWANDCAHPNGEVKGSWAAYEPERVTVPAGTFTAVRVESEQTFRGRAGRATFWYASGVGQVKLVSYGRETCLKSFTPGKD